MPKIDETSKPFVCRNCATFLDTDELIDGDCPNCETDEGVYQNDLLETDEE